MNGNAAALLDCADELLEAALASQPEGWQPIALLRELVDIDWCIGYEMTEEMQARIDDIRTRAAMFLDALPPAPAGAPGEKT